MNQNQNGGLGAGCFIDRDIGQSNLHISTIHMFRPKVKIGTVHHTYRLAKTCHEEAPLI